MCENTTDPEQTEQCCKYLAEMELAIHCRTDRFFALLLLGQWLAAIAAACVISPLAWAGTSSNVHAHVWYALLLGGLISILPAYLGLKHGGSRLTRHVIVAAQALTSALLIHLCGGRIETHFHVFGSLALIGFYCDWTVYLTAVAIVGTDHFVRGLYFPLSVYGVAFASPWRSLEHSAWVAIESAFLIRSCFVRRAELKETAQNRAATYAVNRSLNEKTHALLQAQETVQQREQQIRAVLYNAADAILTFDDQSEIVAANKAAEQLFGTAGNHLTGENLSLLMDTPAQDVIANALVRLDADGSTEASSSTFELTVRTAHGTPIKTEVTLSAMMSGARRFYTAILRDVTERDLMEVQLRQAQKLESIGQLAAGIAHEINTPIQFVGDNTRFLQDEFANINKLFDTCDRMDPASAPADLAVCAAELKSLVQKLDVHYLKDEIPRAIEQTLDGVERVTRIVRAMKDFSHPGSSEKQMIDINRAIESTVVVSTNEWKYVSDVVTDFDSSLPLVPCLPSEFNQVILNLIVNAVHAIEDAKEGKPGGKGKIVISTRNSADAVEIRVADTGTGIPASIANRVFDPFFTTKALGKGTGQGLSLARSIIVNKHGGTLDFETECGKGTTFVIRLPLRLASKASVVNTAAVSTGI